MGVEVEEGRTHKEVGECDHRSAAMAVEEEETVGTGSSLHRSISHNPPLGCTVAVLSPFLFRPFFSDHSNEALPPILSPN